CDRGPRGLSYDRGLGAVLERHLSRLGRVRARHRRAAAPACRAVRPQRPGGGGTGMRRSDQVLQLLGPVGLLALVGLVGSLVSAPRALEVTNALVSAAVVVALYVFVGNSGVLSFGQIGFFIVGAHAAGEMTVPSDVKLSVLPNVFSPIRDHTISNPESLVLAAGIGAIYALLVGIPL